MMKPAYSPSSGTSADRDPVLKAVKQIMGERLGIPADEIQQQQALIEYLGFDSLDIVELTMEIEEHFDISVPDEAGQRINTIADVTDGVIQLRS